MTRTCGFLMVVVLGWLPMAAQEVELPRGVFSASEVCGECHEEIYAMWKRSLHSAALSDPIFETSFMQAFLETDGKARKVCYRCHAPIAVETGDLTLRNPVSREGVSCDFCHSIVSVDLSRTAAFKLAKDGVKRGPLKDAESPVHGVEKSALHESSELCAGCHEYINDHNVSIMSTYSEWKLSPQASEGKQCQNCHMPMTKGETVRAGVREKDRRTINLHNISGFHSTEQVRKAAAAKIVTLRRDNKNYVTIEVEVANIGSGHSIPTGLPTRRLVLDVVLYSGKRPVRQFQRVYERALADETGRRITQDHRAMLHASKVIDDNRLRPGERRLERFVGAVSDPGTLRAEARLRYVYEPNVISREPITIEIQDDRAYLDPK